LGVWFEFLGRDACKIVSVGDNEGFKASDRKQSGAKMLYDEIYLRG